MNEILLSKLIQRAAANRILELSDTEYEILDLETAVELSETLGSNTLIKLPKEETDFFEWLKNEDEPVWKDLWAEQDEEPYVVAISFLPLLLDRNTGFPICDLLTADNYYFTEQHIPDKEAKMLIETIKEKYIEKQPLTVAQLLLLTISFAPVDIWHFAYNNGISLKDAKRAVETLVEDKLLIHLKDASHLAGFITF